LLIDPYAVFLLSFYWDSRVLSEQMKGVDRKMEYTFLFGGPIVHKLEPQLWKFPFLFIYLLALEKFPTFEKLAPNNVTDNWM